jgi:hypothetical protein
MMPDNILWTAKDLVSGSAQKNRGIDGADLSVEIAREDCDTKFKTKISLHIEIVS